MKPAIATLLSIIVIVILACKTNPKTRKADANRELVHTDANPYRELRDMALNMKREEVLDSATEKNDNPYGIVMDIGIDDGSATIISFLSGDASMYTSTGGGIIGGHAHENVSNAAKTFVSTAQLFISTATPASNTAVPKKGEVTFYILRPNGRQVVRESLATLEQGNSPFQKLFEAGNDVITQLRLTQDAETN